MDKKQQDCSTILQNLVDQFLDIQISLEIISEDSRQILDWREQHGFVFDFDDRTGQLQTVGLRPLKGKEEEKAADSIGQMTEAFKGFCKDAGKSVIEQVDSLSKCRQNLDQMLAALPDKVHGLLSSLQGSIWPLHVRRHCLLPLKYWPQNPTGQDWHLSISRARRPGIPGRLDLLLKFVEEVDPTTHWKQICRQIDSYIDDIMTIATEVHAIVKIEPPKGPFVPSPMQDAILTSLKGHALTKQLLANMVCAGEGSRLYKNNGIKELVDAGLVTHKYGVGYYREDFPPSNAVY